MASLNLDQKRAARNATPHEVTLGGEVFHWPAELPITFAELLSDGKLTAAVGVALGDEAEAFLALGPTMDDIGAIAEGLYATP